jgi:hypothetical protein
MAAEPKPKAAKKKKRRSAPAEAVVQYTVTIEGWDWSYTLLNDDKRPVDPYHEFRHLQIVGRLLRPTGLKTDRVEISLLPTTSMSEETRKTKRVRLFTEFASRRLAAHAPLLAGLSTSRD